MKDRVAVVVPFYHEELSETEKISLENCLNTFKEKYPIILVVPEKIKKNKSLTREGVIYESVPDDWMKSVESYNQMMLSEGFYCRFLNYEYILIFQLDAFAFSDSLNFFCDFGYDYIGAPWLKGIRYLRNLKKGVWFVGNGGFSLRKVESFATLSRAIETKAIDRHEDIFWASCDSEKFRVAPIDIALKFSFEQDVRQCFLKNNSQLPFGCHAWEKYDFDFWRPVFEERGYRLSCEIPDGIDNSNHYPRWDYCYLDVEPTIIKKCLNELFGKTTETIFIFGTGKIGEECCWLLQRIEGIQVGYIDDNSNNYGKKLWNVFIDSYEIIDSKQKNDGVLIADKEHTESVLYRLNRRGLKYKKDIFLYDDLIEIIRKYC